MSAQRRAQVTMTRASTETILSWHQDQGDSADGETLWNQPEGRKPKEHRVCKPEQKSGWKGKTHRPAWNEFEHLPAKSAALWEPGPCCPCTSDTNSLFGIFCLTCSSSRTVATVFRKRCSARSLQITNKDRVIPARVTVVLPQRHCGFCCCYNWLSRHQDSWRE